MSNRDRILALVDRIANSRDAKQLGWPGAPTAQVWTACTDTDQELVRQLIAEDVLERVERPGTIDPTRTATFIRRTVRAGA